MTSVKLPWRGKGFDVVYDGPIALTAKGISYVIAVVSHRTGRRRAYRIETNLPHTRGCWRSLEGKWPLHPSRLVSG